MRSRRRRATVAVGAPSPHEAIFVHLLDPTGAFGGFYEELLCAPPGV
jgi:hypothetical protein